MGGKTGFAVVPSNANVAAARLLTLRLRTEGRCGCCISRNGTHSWIFATEPPTRRVETAARAAPTAVNGELDNPRPESQHAREVDAWIRRSGIGSQRSSRGQDTRRSGHGSRALFAPRPAVRVGSRRPTRSAVRPMPPSAGRTRDRGALPEQPRRQSHWRQDGPSHETLQIGFVCCLGAH